LNWANLETDVTFLEAAETGKGRSLLTLALTMAVIGSAIASAVIFPRNSRVNDGAGILSLRAWGTATASLNTVSAPASSRAPDLQRFRRDSNAFTARRVGQETKIQDFPVIMSNLVG